MKTEKEIKDYLEQRLVEEYSFQSFDKRTCRNLSDWNLIKYVLLHLDLDDIRYLFHLYPKQEIKKVWLNELVPQGEFLIAMNLCFALLYFDAKKPHQYLKAMQTRQLNKLINSERSPG
jgi:hypothetical protein